MPVTNLEQTTEPIQLQLDALTKESLARAGGLLASKSVIAGTTLKSMHTPERAQGPLITTFGEHEPGTIEQLERCAEKADFAVLCADGHEGKSQPIGSAIAYEHHISVSGVGVDIGCGNKAVKTNIKAEDIPVAQIMDQVFSEIGFGGGKVSHWESDHAVLDKIKTADFEPQRQLYDTAAQQLGTVGGGNHFVDLFEGEDGLLWVGVHFGSRGFGKKTADGFFAQAQGRDFFSKPEESRPKDPPLLLDTRTEEGQAYIAAMQLAGEYAYANRDVVVAKVLDILGAENTYEVHNHHNFAWREEHHGKPYWVVRKGSTPVFPGQESFVGASMDGTSVILEGVESSTAQSALYSTVHGAGRKMSRSQATGKQKWFTADDGTRQLRFSRPPRIDWENVQREMRAKGIELRGGGPDEAPGVYKDLPEVLEAQGDSIRIKHRLRPIGVAMDSHKAHTPFDKGTEPMPRTASSKNL